MQLSRCHLAVATPFRRNVGRGFTLIECSLLIAIIAILAVMLLPS